MLALGLACAGFGVSLALPALTTAVITTAPEGAAGAAGGLLNAVRQVGATLGVAVMGAFITIGAPTTATNDHGIAAAVLLSAAVCTTAWLAVASRR